MNQKTKIIGTGMIFIVLLISISLSSAFSISSITGMVINGYSSPEISDAYIQPSKVRPGDIMLVVSLVQDDYGIDSVTASMPFEGGSDLIELELSEGDVLDGKWQGTWKVHDTIEKEYVTTITAANVKGKSSSVNITWYDPNIEWWNTSWKYEKRITVQNCPDGWWNPGGGQACNYLYRQNINVTNNNLTEVLEDGYTVNITFNMTDFVNQGKMNASGNDTRIVWYNVSDSTYNEIDRIIERGNGSDSNLTKIWFRTQENISAGGWDNNYSLYYGNPSAGSPPANGSEVYLIWDDFSTNTSANYLGNWTWDNTDGSVYRIAGKTWYYAYNLTAKNVIMDAVVQADSSINLYGQPGIGFYGDPTVDTDNFYFMTYNYYNKVIVRDYVGGTNYGGELAGEVTDWDTWYDFRLTRLENNVTFRFKKTNELSWARSENYTLNTNFNDRMPALTSENQGARIDFWRVRKYVSTEPSVALQGEETYTLLEDGYTVNITFNMTDFVNQGKMNASGNDTRIVWYNSSDSTYNEIDRIIEPSSALRFDGSDDYVETPPQMAGLSNWSIEAWIKPVIGDDTQNHIIGPGGSSVQIWVTGGNTVQFLLGGNYAQYNSLSYGVWSHIVFTANSTGHYLYVNGSLRDSNTGTGSIGSGNWRIGDYFSGGYSFNGTIDEVSIFNRSLNSTEISDLYNGGIGRPIDSSWFNTTGLVGLWHFDIDGNDNSTLAYDSSGNGNNGTINGSYHTKGYIVPNAEADNIIYFSTQQNITAVQSDNNYSLYYGNPSAGSPPANGSNVYLFYDDFEDGTLNKWTVSAGGAEAVKATFGGRTSYYLHTYDVSGTRGQIYSNPVTAVTSGIWEFKYGYAADNDERSYIIITDGSNPTATIYAPYDNGVSKYFYDGGFNSVGYSFTPGTLYDMAEIVKQSSPPIVEETIDGLIQGSDVAETGKNAASHDRIEFWSGTALQDQYIDDVRLRKYTSFEPSTSLGTERQLFTINSCGVLDQQNSLYLLTSNVTSSGTCFTIEADNVMLDCQGYAIEYANTSNGIGINSTNRNHTAIKNCYILDESGGGYGEAIYLYSSYFSDIVNNTVVRKFVDATPRYAVYFYNSGYGSIEGNNFTSYVRSGKTLYLDQSSHNIITNNSISLYSGNSGRSYALRIASSTNVTLAQNILESPYGGALYITGGSSQYYNHNIDSTNSIWSEPIYYYYNADNQIFDGNDNFGILYIAASDNVTVRNIATVDTNGIVMSFVNNSNIYSNSINTTAGSTLYLGESYNTNITGNYLNSTGSTLGIATLAIYDASDNILAENNTVFIDSEKGRGIVSSGVNSNIVLNNNTVKGTNQYGSEIYVGGCQLGVVMNNTVSNNIIDGKGDGISLNCPGTLAENNTILTTSSSAAGISMSSRDYNTIRNNVINVTTCGGSYRYGIEIISGSDNNEIYNNTVVSCDEAIRIYKSGSMTVYDNNLTSTGSNAIYIYSASPGNNTFYNNIINSSLENIVFAGTVYQNSFNTTNQTGPNIAGGSYIGGNFWAYANGTGFSEKCADADTDGFCDNSVYDLPDSNASVENTDWLTLTTSAINVLDEQGYPSAAIIHSIGDELNVRCGKSRRQDDIVNVTLIILDNSSTSFGPYQMSNGTGGDAELWEYNWTIPSGWVMDAATLTCQARNSTGDLLNLDSVNITIKVLNMTEIEVQDNIIYESETAIINGTIYREPDHEVSANTVIRMKVSDGNITGQRYEWTIGSGGNNWSTGSFDNTTTNPNYLVLGVSADFFNRADTYNLNANTGKNKWNNTGTHCRIRDNALDLTSYTEPCFDLDTNISGYNLTFLIKNTTASNWWFRIFFYSQNSANRDDTYKLSFSMNMDMVDFINRSGGAENTIESYDGPSGIDLGTIITIDTSTVSTGLNIYVNNSLWHTFLPHSQYSSGYAGTVSANSQGEIDNWRATIRDAGNYTTETKDAESIGTAGSVWQKIKIEGTNETENQNFTIYWNYSSDNITYNLETIGIVSPDTKYTLANQVRYGSWIVELKTNDSSKTPELYNVTLYSDWNFTGSSSTAEINAESQGNYEFAYKYPGISTIQSVNFTINSTDSEGVTGSFESNSDGATYNITVYPDMNITPWTDKTDYELGEDITAYMNVTYGTVEPSAVSGTEILYLLYNSSGSLFYNSSWISTSQKGNSLTIQSGNFTRGGIFYITAKSRNININSSREFSNNSDSFKYGTLNLTEIEVQDNIIYESETAIINGTIYREPDHEVSANTVILMKVSDGNITGQRYEWTIGSGGDDWTGNVSHTNTTEVRATGYAELGQLVDDYAAYWRFDEGNGTIVIDEVGYNNGTLNGDINWTTTGKFGGGLKISNESSDYISVPHNDSLEPVLNTSCFTMWVYPFSDWNDGNYHGMFLKEAPPNSYATGKGFGFSKSKYGNNFLSSRRTNQTQSYSKDYGWYGSMPWEVEWNFMGVCLNLSGVKIWWTDSSRSETSGYYSDPFDGGNISAPGYTLNFFNNVNATVDDVRVFKRAFMLTDLEINQTRDNYHKLPGNITSIVKDAESSGVLGNLWENISFDGSLPAGTNVSVYWNYSSDNISYSLESVCVSCSPGKYGFPTPARYGSWITELDANDSSVTPVIYNVTVSALTATDSNGKYLFYYYPSPASAIRSVNFTLNATDSSGVTGSFESNSDGATYNITVYPDLNETNATIYADRTYYNKGENVSVGAILRNSGTGELLQEMNLKARIYGPQGESSADANTVLLLHMNEGIGNYTNDSSSYGNNGTLYNSTTICNGGDCPVWTTGKYGSALSFDGVDDYVSIPDDNSLDITGDKITLSAWVYVNSYNPSSRMALVSKYRNYAMQIREDGTLVFSGQGWVPSNLSGTVPLNEWVHTVITYDGDAPDDRVKFYINSTFVYATNWTGGYIATGSWNLTIGHDPVSGGSVTYFNGTIDEVQIFDRALSVDEIKMLYEGYYGTKVSEVDLTENPDSYFEGTYRGTFETNTTWKDSWYKIRVALEVDDYGENIEGEKKVYLNPLNLTVSSQCPSSEYEQGDTVELVDYLEKYDTTSIFDVNVSDAWFNSRNELMANQSHLVPSFKSCGSPATTYTLPTDPAVAPGGYYNITLETIDSSLANNKTYREREFFVHYPFWDEDTTDYNFLPKRVRVILDNKYNIKKNNAFVSVNGSELAGAGVDINSVVVDSIRVVDQDIQGEGNELWGRAIPYEVEDSGDNILNSSDSIEFLVNISSDRKKVVYIYYADAGSFTTTEASGLNGTSHPYISLKNVEDAPVTISNVVIEESIYKREMQLKANVSGYTPNPANTSLNWYLGYPASSESWYGNLEPIQNNTFTIPITITLPANKELGVWYLRVYAEDKFPNPDDTAEYKKEFLVEEINQSIFIEPINYSLTTATFNISGYTILASDGTPLNNTNITVYTQDLPSVGGQVFSNYTTSDSSGYYEMELLVSVPHQSFSLFGETNHTYNWTENQVLRGTGFVRGNNETIYEVKLYTPTNSFIEVDKNPFNMINITSEIFNTATINETVDIVYEIYNSTGLYTTLFMNGTILPDYTTANYTRSWDIRNVPVNNYTIYVEVYDVDKSWLAGSDTSRFYRLNLTSSIDTADIWTDVNISSNGTIYWHNGTAIDDVVYVYANGSEVSVPEQNKFRNSSVNGLYIAELPIKVPDQNYTLGFSSIKTMGDDAAKGVSFQQNLKVKLRTYPSLGTDNESYDANEIVTVYLNVSNTANWTVNATAAFDIRGDYLKDAVGIWTFEDASGNTTDISGNNNDGAPQDGNATNSDGNTPPQRVSGKFGKALGFDGVDDYVDLPDLQAAGTGKDQVTVTAWFKTSSLNNTIFNFGVDNIRLSIRNQRSIFYIRNSSGLIVLSLPQLMILGEWNFLAGVYNGSEMKIYYNAVEIGSTPQTGDIRNLPSDITLGYEIGRAVEWPSLNPTDFFNGTIDEVGIWSRALSGTEIQDLYYSSLDRYNTTFNVSLNNIAEFELRQINFTWNTTNNKPDNYTIYVDIIDKYSQTSGSASVNITLNTTETADLFMNITNNVTNYTFGMYENVTINGSVWRTGNVNFNGTLNVYVKNRDTSSSCSSSYGKTYPVAEINYSTPFDFEYNWSTGSNIAGNYTAYANFTWVDEDNITRYVVKEKNFTISSVKQMEVTLEVKRNGVVINASDNQFSVSDTITVITYYNNTGNDYLKDIGVMTLPHKNEIALTGNDAPEFVPTDGVLSLLCEQNATETFYTSLTGGPFTLSDTQMSTSSDYTIIGNVSIGAVKANDSFVVSIKAEANFNITGFIVDSWNIPINAMEYKGVKVQLKQTGNYNFQNMSIQHPIYCLLDDLNASTQVLVDTTETNTSFAVAEGTKLVTTNFNAKQIEVFDADASCLSGNNCDRVCYAHLRIYTEYVENISKGVLEGTRWKWCDTKAGLNCDGNAEQIFYINRTEQSQFANTTLNQELFTQLNTNITVNTLLNNTGNAQLNGTITGKIYNGTAQLAVMSCNVSSVTLDVIPAESVKCTWNNTNTAHGNYTANITFDWTSGYTGTAKTDIPFEIETRNTSSSVSADKSGYLAYEQPNFSVSVTNSGDVNLNITLLYEVRDDAGYLIDSRTINKGVVNSAGSTSDYWLWNTIDYAPGNYSINLTATDEVGTAWTAGDSFEISATYRAELKITLVATGAEIEDKSNGRYYEVTNSTPDISETSMLSVNNTGNMELDGSLYLYVVRNSNRYDLQSWTVNDLKKASLGSNTFSSSKGFTVVFECTESSSVETCVETYNKLPIGTYALTAEYAHTSGNDSSAKNLFVGGLKLTIYSDDVTKVVKPYNITVSMDVAGNMTTGLVSDNLVSVTMQASATQTESGQSYYTDFSSEARSNFTDTGGGYYQFYITSPDGKGTYNLCVKMNDTQGRITEACKSVKTVYYKVIVAMELPAAGNYTCPEGAKYGKILQGGSLKGIVFAGTGLEGIECTSRKTEVEQDMSGAITYIVFTKSTNLFEKRAAMIEKGTFLKEINPSFGYGLTTQKRVSVSIAYDDINITGKELFQRGNYKIVVVNNGTVNGMPLIEIWVE